MADFTDKTHNLADLSGKTGIFPDIHPPEILSLSSSDFVDYEPPWVLIPHNTEKEALRLPFLR